MRRYNSIDIPAHEVALHRVAKLKPPIFPVHQMTPVQIKCLHRDVNMAADEKIFGPIVAFERDVLRLPEHHYLRAVSVADDLAESAERGDAALATDMLLPLFRASERRRSFRHQLQIETLWIKMLMRDLTGPSAARQLNLHSADLGLDVMTRMAQSLAWHALQSGSQPQPNTPS